MASLVPPVLCEGEKKLLPLGWVGRGRAGWGGAGSALGSRSEKAGLAQALCALGAVGSPIAPWIQPFLGLLTKRRLMPPRPTWIPPTLTPNADNVPLAFLILTLAGCHVYTLLFLADGSRSSRCPRDEVYNRAICPPTEAENSGSASSISSTGGHRTEAPMGPSAPRPQACASK